MKIIDTIKNKVENVIINYIYYKGVESSTEKIRVEGKGMLYIAYSDRLLKIINGNGGCILFATENSKEDGIIFLEEKFKDVDILNFDLRYEKEVIVFHEIGHYYHNHDVAKTLKDKIKQEFEADEFAASILGVDKIIHSLSKHKDKKIVEKRIANLKKLA